MEERKTEARRIVEGLRLYRRGLRQLATGDADAARTSARDIAALCLEDVHALNMRRHETNHAGADHARRKHQTTQRGNNHD